MSLPPSQSAAASPATTTASFSVSPAAASVEVGAKQQFTAALSNSTSATFTWEVNGVAGGNSTVGTVSATGVYAAPKAIPNPPTITVTALSKTSSQKASASVTVTGGGAGGLYPNARHDLAVVQESPLPFQIGPQGYTNMSAGTIFKEPDFGERMMRVTDNETMPNCWPTAQNSSMHVPASPEVPMFSSDEHWFFVQDNDGFDYLFAFNPLTMQATCKKVESTSHGQLPLSNAGFGRSAADAGILFAAHASAPYQLWKYNVADYADSYDSGSMVFDMSTCPGLSWLSSMPAKAIDYQPVPQITVDDEYIAWLLGPVQNEAWLSLYYQTTTGKCGWVDTRTGKIGGDLWPGVTQVESGFPMDWNRNRGPAAPAAETAKASAAVLKAGHAIKVQFSLTYLSNGNGQGESSATPPQTVTVAAGDNAVSLPAPDQSGFDSMIYTHYNVYACDETVSGSNCTPTLQPASNLGCTMAAPEVSVTPHAFGSTTYSYAVMAYGPDCNTWSQATITNGAATANNTITWTVPSGALHVSVYAGAPGSAAVFTNGASTVDPTAYPAIIAEESATTTSYTDRGGSVLELGAIGTLPCYAQMSYSGLPWPSSTTDKFYHCSNGTTLTAVSTTGPAVPTHASNLGVWNHYEYTSMLSQPYWTQWIGEQSNNLFWNADTAKSDWCNGLGYLEYPAAYAYSSCVGHDAVGGQGWINRGNYADDPDYGYFYHTFSSFPSVATDVIHKFPALDPNGYENLDQHQSWGDFGANGRPLTDLQTPFLVSTDTGTGAASSKFQGPLYIGRAWQREIFAVDPATGTVYRFAHHRSSTVYQYQAACGSPTPCEGAFWHNSLAMISPHGDFSLFNSDMEWRLGCDPQSPVACTYNSSGQVDGPRSPVAQSREDVFMVELK